jgi:hypothetical protein
MSSATWLCFMPPRTRILRSTAHPFVPYEAQDALTRRNCLITARLLMPQGGRMPEMLHGTPEETKIDVVVRLSCHPKVADCDLTRGNGARHAYDPG